MNCDIEDASTHTRRTILGIPARVLALRWIFCRIAERKTNQGAQIYTRVLFIPPFDKYLPEHPPFTHVVLHFSLFKPSLLRSDK